MKHTNRKLVCVLAALLIGLLITGCSGGGSGESSGSNSQSSDQPASQPADTTTSGDLFKVGMVTDMPIDGAQWLRDTVNAMEDYAAANDDVEFTVIESGSVQEFEQTIRLLAENGSNLIFTWFTGMADATVAVSKDFPNVCFGIYDGFIDNLPSYGNIADFGVYRPEGSYLAGVCAAAMSESGTVGIIGGFDEPVINEAIAGWQQGLVSVNPDITDYVMYANSWSDPAKGKELGLVLVERGCDVIAAAASGATVGAAQAANETGVWFVAWDTHYEEVFTDDMLELGSNITVNKPMLLDMIEKAKAGTFPAGERIEYGIESPASYFEILSGSLISDEARAMVDEAREGILSGEISTSRDMLHK